MSPSPAAIAPLVFLAMAFNTTVAPYEQRPTSPLPPLPVCPASVADVSSLTAHFDLIKCYDSAWRWGDAYRS